jgi:hypothetical protein
VFNQLTPAEVVTAIGRTARESARGTERSSDYARGQLMSAYSISRHLAVEIDVYAPELNAFAADVAAWAADFGPSDPIGAVAEQLRSARDASEIADALCLLLERLRADGSEPAAQLRTRVRGRLRRLADREVDLLAEVIEPAA